MQRFLLSLALLSGCDAFCAGSRFPGAAEGCSSPDGHFWVSYIPPSESESHRLQIGVAGAPKYHGRPLLGFNRSCDVLWSPDSKRLALTDWGGSDYSEIVLVEVGKEPGPVTLGAQSFEKMMTWEESHGHCYCEAVQWLDGDRLQVRVFGHADQAPLHEFDYRFMVHVPSGLVTLSLKGEEANHTAEPGSPSRAG